MSNISQSSNNTSSLQQFNAKIAELVTRKRKLEEANSSGIKDATVVKDSRNEQLRSARYDQLVAKTNEATRLERLKAARRENHEVPLQNRQSVDRKLVKSDNAIYRQATASDAKTDSQRVVEDLDIQKTESRYYAQLAADLVNRQIFALKLGDKRLDAKINDIKAQDSRLITQISEEDNLETDRLEKSALEKSNQLDDDLNPDFSETPALLTKRRMEKLVEIIEGKSVNKEGISLQI